MKHQIQYSILTDEQHSEWNRMIFEHRNALICYADQLLWWNTKVNLVSRDVSHETIIEHIKHSLLLGTMESLARSKRVIDTGSGGGLPGIPLSICFPEKRFLLNDIVSKKVMSMKQMAFKLNLPNVKTEAESIERLRVLQGDIIVTKHAFKIDQLVNYLSDSNWKTLLFLKGVLEAEPEIKRLDIPVSSNIIELDTSIDDPFYKGKGIIEVNRIDE